MTSEAALATPYSAGDLRLRLAAATPLRGDELHGDHRFTPQRNPRFSRDALRKAAVLIAVVDRPGGATVILTKRAETLRDHTGQVAFPGGRIDDVDPSPEFAALREAEEEIGLDPAWVQVIGRLPDYATGSGYRIAPVLGLLRPGFRLRINAEEVDEAFEVPLSFLMNPVNHRRSSRFWGDEEWFFYEMPYGSQRIWGITAGIIRTLYERLYA